jgi:hypothetical protein
MSWYVRSGDYTELSDSQNFELFCVLYKFVIVWPLCFLEEIVRSVRIIIIIP